MDRLNLSVARKMRENFMIYVP